MDNFKILLYEWIQTAEAKRENALQNAVDKTKRYPHDMQIVADYFIQVARFQEFKEFQATLYDLLK